MEQINDQTKLSKKFFELLKRYKEILGMTNDENFRIKAPGILGDHLLAKFDAILSQKPEWKNSDQLVWFFDGSMEQRSRSMSPEDRELAANMQQAVFELMATSERKLEYIKTQKIRYQKSINVLQNYNDSLNDYEVAISERNWAYKTQEEIERDRKVYMFLLKYRNFYARQNKLRQLKKDYNKLIDEFNAIQTLKSDFGNYVCLMNFPEAIRCVQEAENEFIVFAFANPDDPYLVKKDLTPDRIDKRFIDKHLDELIKLESKHYPETKKKSGKGENSNHSKMSDF